MLKSDGAQLRSYCYVADAVRGLLAVLLSGARGEAYNVAARGGAHTIREYAETLARLAGVRVAFDLPPEAERRGYSAVTRGAEPGEARGARLVSARAAGGGPLAHAADSASVAAAVMPRSLSKRCAEQPVKSNPATCAADLRYFSEGKSHFPEEKYLPCTICGRSFQKKTQANW